MRIKSHLLKISVALMLLALVLLLLCLSWFTPRTMGAFMSFGLGSGVLGILLFLVYVITDLRTRRVL